MKLTDFCLATTRKKARSVLQKLGGEALPVAGGTALHFYGDSGGKTAVDIMRIGWSGIRKSKGMYRIGATTLIADIMNCHQRGWVLDDVAVRLSTQPIRNISTLGGNIARVFPWADFPVALLALNATMLIQGDTERAVGADEFFASQPARLFQPGDLLSAVLVPPVGRGTGFGYHKENRVNAAFSMMTAAALLTVEGGMIKDLRLAAGAAIPFPKRLTAVEVLLKGKPAEEGEFEAALAGGAADMPWKGKEGLSDEYAKNLAQVVLRDTLAQALKRAKGVKS